MSKKTIKQHIASVAVLALTAGVFSVVSAPSANAAVAATNYNWSSSTTAGANVYTSANGGFCSQDNTTDVLSIRYPSSLSGGTINLTVGSANTDTVATEYVVFAATGTGYFTTATAAADASELAITKSTDEKTLTIGAGSASDLPDSIGWRQTAVGTTTINQYVVLASTGAMTLLETFTLIAAAGCTAGEYSPIYSGSSLRTASTALTATTYDDGDDSGASAVENAVGVAYLGVWLSDSLGGEVTDTSSFLNVTSTGGCTISGTTVDLSSTSTSIVVTSGIHDKVIKVFTSGAKQNSCNVKASYNGTEVANKNITFRGDSASVVVTAKDAAIGTASVGAGYYDVLDDKGSRIGSVTSATAVEATGSMIGATISFAASTFTSTQAAITIDAVDTARGEGTFKIRVTTNAGAFITSAPVSMLVSTGVSTYTMSLDKASYSPGQIVSVTISAKDSGGRIVPDGTALSTSGNLDFTIAGSTPLAAAPAYGDVSDAGSWKYKYIAGTTEGDWAANLGLNNIVTDTAKQGTYVIKSTSTTVSNAEVLKSIVALIASINKQIQALQKLILKR
jgi:hypothetical protein